MRVKDKSTLPGIERSSAEYFSLISQKKYAQARRLLEEKIQRKGETEWDKGYRFALAGMLAALGSDAKRYTFIKNMKSKELERMCEEFQEIASNELLKPFDRGYFTAWFHYTRLLSRNLTQEGVEESPDQQPHEEVGTDSG
ncbi:MAG: hypothetical protein ACE5OY_00855 [Candidatus Bathyarchaeia archaeon]